MCLDRHIQQCSYGLVNPMSLVRTQPLPLIKDACSNFEEIILMRDLKSIGVLVNEAHTAIFVHIFELWCIVPRIWERGVVAARWQ